MPNHRSGQSAIARPLAQVRSGQLPRTGETLVAILAVHGLSQTCLAARAHLQPTAMHEIVRGTRPGWPIDRLEAAAPSVMAAWHTERAEHCRALAVSAPPASWSSYTLGVAGAAGELAAALNRALANDGVIDATEEDDLERLRIALNERVSTAPRSER